MNKILLLFELFFAKTYFYKINKFLYLLSLKGMGIDNQEKIVCRGEKKLLNTILHRSESQVVIDVGANVGNYAEDVLKYNPNIKLYAFEPHPKTYKKLIEKSEKLNFEAINKGCADEIGKLKFYDYASNDGSEHATLLAGVFENIYHKDTIVYEVDVTTLDNFIQDRKIQKVDLLKIDTEGFEYNVLKGLEQSLKANKIKAIHFEFNSMNIIGKVFMKDFINLLPQYNFYRVLPDGLLKIEKDKILLTEIFGFQNIIAVLN